MVAHPHLARAGFGDWRLHQFEHLGPPYWENCTRLAMVDSPSGKSLNQAFRLIGVKPPRALRGGMLRPLFPCKPVLRRAQADQGAFDVSKHIEAVKAYLLDLQDRICAELAAEDGGAGFVERLGAPAGGGGRTRVLETAKLIERAGSTSPHVFGSSLPPSASAHRPELAGRGFQALGVSW